MGYFSPPSSEEDLRMILKTNFREKAVLFFTLQFCLFFVRIDYYLIASQIFHLSHTPLREVPVDPALMT